MVVSSILGKGEIDINNSMQGDSVICMLTIIIPTKDEKSQRYLDCVENLNNCLITEDFKICPIVSSGDDFRFSKSVNAGFMQNPNSDFYLILIDDCYPNRGAIDSMISTFKSNRNSGVVGANIRTPDGNIDHLGGVLSLTTFSGVINALKRGYFSWAVKMPMIHLYRRLFHGTGKSIEGFHIHSHDDGRKIDFVTGACFLVSKETIDRVGLFDEQFEFRAEDLDYCLRTTSAGMRVILDVDALATHEVGASGFDKGKVRRSGVHFRNKYNPDKIKEIRRQRDKSSA